MDKNSNVYKKAIDMANDKYGEKSSIYRSSYIVKMYKELGGEKSLKKKSLKKKSKKNGLNRWFTEDWIQVSPFLEKGQKIECGGKRVSDRVGKSCRPLYRITKDTPITIPELLEIHTKKSIIKIAKEKERSPNKRVDWKKLKITKD
jgi:hypothetical protein